MDIHHRVVGVLHIVSGLLVLAVLALVGLFFGAFFSLGDVSRQVGGFFATLGAVVAVPFALMALGEVVAAAALLRGSRAARAWVIAFSVLGLLNVPFGTALGIYSLWALLRDAPSASPTELPVVRP